MEGNLEAATPKLGHHAPREKPGVAAGCVYIDAWHADEVVQDLREVAEQLDLVEEQAVGSVAPEQAVYVVDEGAGISKGLVAEAVEVHLHDAVAGHAHLQQTALEESVHEVRLAAAAKARCLNVPTDPK